MKIARNAPNGTLARLGIHLPLRRLALCLDCDECFELGFARCPACGSGTWSAVARFLDLVTDPHPRRAAATSSNKLLPRRTSTPAPPARYLLIVARQERQLYEDLARAFAGHAGVEVLLDRRASDRRQRPTGAPVLEQRRAERRRQAIDEQLRGFGWALVPADPPRARRI